MKGLQELRFRWNRGIHQQPNFALPDHVKDARNVWAPEGEVRLRPGLVHIPGDNFFWCHRHDTALGYDAVWDNFSNSYMYWHDTSLDVWTQWTVGAAPWAPWHNMAVGDYVYFGMKEDPANPVTDPREFAVIVIGISNGCPTTRYVFQYWDGSVWRTIPNSIATGRSGYGATLLMSLRTGRDWEQATLAQLGGTGTTDPAYWLRMYLYEGSITALSELRWSLGVPTTQYYAVGVEQEKIDQAKIYPFFRTFNHARGKLYLCYEAYKGWTEATSSARSRMHIRRGLTGQTSNYIGSGFKGIHGLINVSSYFNEDLDPGRRQGYYHTAFVQEQEEIYMASQGQVWRLDLTTEDLRSSDAPAGVTRYRYSVLNTWGGSYPGQVWWKPATVEDSGALVSDPSAPFNKDYLAQENVYPAASAIYYFDERLFFCGFRESPRMIRWSMAGSGRRVIPSLGYTFVTGDSQRPLLGFMELGDNLLVYDEDNVWRLSFVELDSFGIPHYEPTLVMRGIGCVAPGSVSSYSGGVVFLSRRGLIAYDGAKHWKVGDFASKGQKTDRLADFWLTVNWGKAAEVATCIDWKAKKHFLLALPTGQSDKPSTVLVWDYDNDVLWLWEIDVLHFFPFEDGVGVFRRDAKVYKLCELHSDTFDKIEASLEPHHLMQGNLDTYRLRQVELVSRTDAGPVTLEVRAQDKNTPRTFNYTFEDTTEGVALGGVTFHRTRECARKKELAVTGERFLLKLTNTNVGEDMLLREARVRLFKMGTR